MGAGFGFLGRSGKEHRAQLKATFSKVIDLALTSEVDALLIAGDLFDSAYPQPGLVREVLYQLKRLDTVGIWTLIVPGTHDRLLPGGVYENKEFSSLPHVHIFKEREMTPFRLDRLDLAVYGRATYQEAGDVLENFRVSPDARWHVGLLHASLTIPGKVERDEMMVSGESIARSGLHYLALGHWHSMGNYGKGDVNACYSGSPEPLEMGKGEAGRVLMVDFEEGAPVRVKPIAVGRRRLLRMTFDAGELGGPNRARVWRLYMAGSAAGFEEGTI
jgi:DNA repair exonuclease SbcCD nuclease subunit